jgi:hypothetical protein
MDSQTHKRRTRFRVLCEKTFIPVGHTKTTLLFNLSFHSLFPAEYDLRGVLRSENDRLETETRSCSFIVLSSTTAFSFYQLNASELSLAQPSDPTFPAPAKLFFISGSSG